MRFLDKLQNVWSKNKSLVCVGLDSDRNKIPAHLRSLKTPLFDFNKVIVDHTADLVCAYKLQFAFYGGAGAEAELESSIRYIRERAPESVVILDAKRGDIGNTAELYAQEAFERYGADAVTVNPYMGGDTLEPFLKWEEKGTIVLCRTSNPGAQDFQDLESSGKKLFEIVADHAARRWNSRGNVALVVGATYPSELRLVREIVGDMPLLVPGVGAQGGDVESAVKFGIDSAGAGMIINSSRGIIFASSGEDFGVAAHGAAAKLREEINLARQNQGISV